MWCEGVKSEIECVPHMQSKKWNSLVKMSCLSLTQFLRYLWRNLFSQSSSKDFAQFSVFRFSAPKWKKVAANQSYVFLQESFHKKAPRLQATFFFILVLKAERNSKKDYPVTQCLSFGWLAPELKINILDASLRALFKFFVAKISCRALKGTQWNNMKVTITMTKKVRACILS